MKKLLSVLISSAVSLTAQDFGNLSAGATSDLLKAISELGEARKSVEAERLPLARKVTELEQQLIARRAELAKAQRFQENQLVELNALKAEARARGDEVKYVESLLTEYAKAFRSRLHFIEEPRYLAILENVDKAAATADLTSAEKLQKRSELLAAALKRADAAIGGEQFDGSALDKHGRLQKGKVALVGPVAMFSGGETAGVLQQELNKSDPTVVQLKDHAQIAGTLASTGSGSLLLDPTLGNAFKLAALDQSLFDHLRQGGLIMIPLVGMALAVFVVAFFKWLSLSRVRLARESDLQTVLAHVENGDREKAIAYARSIPGMVGSVLATAVEHVDEKKEYIEEILYEKMLVARSRLDRGLAFLALAATTGPLLGLLGTVMGMIATFQAISGAGSGDPKQLAAGISEALVCTATGMAVAIPALLLHAFLSRKAKAIVGSMEHTAVGFINGIPAERDTFTTA